MDHQTTPDERETRPAHPAGAHEARAMTLVRRSWQALLHHNSYSRQEESLGVREAHRCVVCHRAAQTQYCPAHKFWCCPQHWALHQRLAHPTKGDIHENDRPLADRRTQSPVLICEILRIRSGAAICVVNARI